MPIQIRVSIGVVPPGCFAMSPLQQMKRVLVTILLELARQSGLDVKLTRDAPDTDVKKVFRRVILKVHPDKVGGCEAKAKRLNEAWSKWLQAGRCKNKGGRPGAGSALVPKQARSEYLNPVEKFWG